jgi:hypothetical protein
LELFTHLGEIFRNLAPCFEDCGVDDFLEELVMFMQGYLRAHVVELQEKIASLTHDTTRFRKLISLDEGDDSFADILRVI